MSLFSSLRKNKQDSPADESAFYSRAEEESKAVRSRTRRKQGGQRDAASDPVLPEKKRARRRLIGAVALVLAAVIGLPMMFDAEPQPLPDDIAIRIPSKDKAAPMESVDPASALESREEMVESAMDEPAPAPAEQPPSAVAPVTASNAKPAEAAANKPAADVQAARTPAKASTPAQTAENAKAESRAAGQSDEAARAKALLEGKTDPKATEAKSGKFVVQVAALASKEKVNELQSKLKQSGIKSYTQTVATGSGERTRIRVGPFASKDEAEKVRARIVKLGLGGTVVPT